MPLLLLQAVLATAVEVSAALLHLHQHNVCHCDLSANNILLKYTASAFSGSVTGRQWCAKVRGGCADPAQLSL